MGAIRYYLVRAWIWLIFAWEKVRSFAPWKALIISYLLMMAAMFVFDFTIYTATGWMPHGLLDLIVSMVVLILIYPRIVRRVYPNGWSSR